MNVFTYGSLMFPPVWQRVVRGTYRSAEATIHGFRRVRVFGKEHPALIIAQGAKPLRGQLYFDVDNADLARLDYFETSNYERVTVAAVVDDVALHAQCYLALNLRELSDEDWNAAEFKQHGLPVFLNTWAVQNAPPDSL
jgi:gamma-glutamylcyclotransferase (GGCT)/AIG2-like uncharacterized protein YtfP